MVKNPPAKAQDTRDTSSIPESGRSPGGGNGNSLQYSCLENPMDRGAWWTTVHRVVKGSDTTEQLINNNSERRSHMPQGAAKKILKKDTAKHSDYKAVY